MASRIKGITVEIGGDTTGLEKALKNVNSTIKRTQSELKDVERLQKLDPSNTELLTQKQKLLKEAQKQAKEQLENGELGQDKYDALQRELIETDDFEETEQACACSVSYSAKESALRNSLGNSSFDLLHQCRKDALNDGEHIRLATVGSHIQTAVYLNHNGANICVTVQMLHRHHRP